MRIPDYLCGPQEYKYYHATVCGRMQGCTRERMRGECSPYVTPECLSLDLLPQQMDTHDEDDACHVHTWLGCLLRHSRNIAQTDMCFIEISWLHMYTLASTCKSSRSGMQLYARCLALDETLARLHPVVKLRYVQRP